MCHFCFFFSLLFFHLPLFLRSLFLAKPVEHLLLDRGLGLGHRRLRDVGRGVRPGVMGRAVDEHHRQIRAVEEEKKKKKKKKKKKNKKKKEEEEEEEE